jgi:sugar lactone lactonase YvrE
LSISLWALRGDGSLARALRGCHCDRPGRLAACRAGFVAMDSSETVGRRHLTRRLTGGPAHSLEEVAMASSTRTG